MDEKNEKPVKTAAISDSIIFGINGMMPSIAGIVSILPVSGSAGRV